MLHGRLPNSKVGTCSEVRRCFMLLGGPGTGKSKVVEFLLSRLRNTVMTMAPTGIAASIICCKTVHAMLALPVPLPEVYVPLTQEALRDLRKAVRSIRAVIIDEVSFLSKLIIHWIDRRLQELFGTEDPFGNVPIIFVGDFFQIPPPAGAKLYTPASVGVGFGAPKRVETNLFAHCYAYELREQHRARGDVLHMRILELLRTNPSEGMDLFLRSVRMLTVEDCKGTGIFADAMLVVPSNEERHAINIQKALHMAEKSGEQLCVWRTGKISSCVEEAMASRPHEVDVFGKNFPCVVNENVSPYVANGST
jgi:hypothetical protein